MPIYVFFLLGKSARFAPVLEAVQQILCTEVNISLSLFSVGLLTFLGVRSKIMNETADFES